jgi:hypothetical protein
MHSIKSADHMQRFFGKPNMIDLYFLFYLLSMAMEHIPRRINRAHRKISGRPPVKDIVTEPKFIVIFMGVKASYGVGLESAPE